MEALDEKGFVFLDDAGRPYRCCVYAGNPWLFYWHPDEQWVSLRQVNQSEIFQMPRNLSQSEQDAYNSRAERHDNAR